LGATGGERVGQSPRRDLPGHTPAILAPSALTLLAAVADDGVPVAIGLFLIVGRDLKRKRLVVFEGRSAVEAQTRNPDDGEFHRQHITLLAIGKIARGLMDGRDRAVWKRR